MVNTDADGRVVILTGPMGAGKTTVAAELVKAQPRPTAYIEGDEFWKFIAHAKPGPPQDAFRIILRAMSATAVAFARASYEAVLDFSMPPGYLDRAAKIFAGVPVHLVVLRPSLGVCVARSAQRETGAIRDESVIAEFYEHFTGVSDRHLIADDDLPAATAARRIRDGIERGEFVYQQPEQPLE